ncbi:MAG: hypothetical protein ACR2FO_00910 [Actinomycetota bacterium]
MRNKKKALFLPLGAVAFLLALASVAWACTSLNGTPEITKITHRPGVVSCPVKPAAGWQCAAPGDSLFVKATGAAQTAGPHNDMVRYYLYFLNYSEIRDGMDTCMPPPEDAAATGVPMLIGGPVMADSSGNIPETEGILPVAGPTGSTEGLLGPGWVCFMGGAWEENDTVDETINPYVSRIGAQNATYYATLNIVMI